MSTVIYSLFSIVEASVNLNLRWYSMSDLKKKLGERIRILRVTKGLTREQLSERSEIHANYIGQVERGEKNLTIETLQKLGAGLNVTLEELIRFLDPMERKDILGEIIEQLSARPPEDQQVALQILRTVFEWEEKKNKGS